MKITLYAMALMTALSIASFAADFNGKLMDATCVDQNHSSASKSPASAEPSSASSSKASCDATSATTAFAIEENGKTYKLDSTGNTKAAEALKSRADRSANPGATPQSYTAKVSGKESSGTISVESIDIQ
jgi:hypothetical protein